jgi:acyl-CoA thioesterase FadM
MNLYFRLLLLAIKYALFERNKEKEDVMATTSLRFHVLPNDLDANMHMNNGRYLTIMDLGRFHYMLRTGIFGPALKKGYAPVLGSAKIRYRLPLLPFHPFDLQTRIITWDEKWVYVEQRFVLTKGDKAGAVAAIALLKASLYDTKAKVTAKPKDILALIDKADIPVPEMPEYVKRWSEAEEALKAETSR